LGVADVQALKQRIDELEDVLVAATKPLRSWQRERQRLDELARLGEDWDSYGGKPPTAIAISTAHDLLAGIAERWTGSDPDLLWAMAPLSDGGVQLEWRAGVGAIEVEIDPTGRLSYLVERDEATTVLLEHGTGERQGIRDEIGRLLDLS